MSLPTPQPRTTAGRALLAYLSGIADGHLAKTYARNQVFAIEAEAAALDVEVLAEALRPSGLSNIAYNEIVENLDDIAERYARLRAERGTA